MVYAFLDLLDRSILAFGFCLIFSCQITFLEEILPAHQWRLGAGVGFRSTVPFRDVWSLFEGKRK